jgi:CelD/BcsL family acetyltransferase involved in cellulose biosynthesis
LTLELRTLSTPDELRHLGAAWDDLWERSDVTLPTLRSELLLAWLDDFAPHRRFRALIVRDGSRLLAGLPLVDMDHGGRWGIGALPNDYWSSTGDLMLDSSSDSSACIELLVAGLRGLPWSLLLLNQIQAKRPPWPSLCTSAGASGMAVHCYDMYRVGTIRFPEDAAAYLARCSRRHRQNMRRAQRMIDQAGSRRLRIYDSLEPDEVEPLLRVGFEIEDRGWKGRAGTAVLRSPALWEHYLRQARLLAASRQLCLVFLEHAGRPIAFEYSFMAKGHYFSPKVSYDEEFARFSPGQLLCHDLYSQMADSTDSPVVDLVGPLNDAERQWNTDEYQVETAMVAVRPVRGRALSAGLRGLRRLRKTARRMKSTANAFKARRI